MIKKVIAVIVALACTLSFVGIMASADDSAAAYDYKSDPLVNLGKVEPDYKNGDFIHGYTTSVDEEGNEVKTLITNEDGSARDILGAASSFMYQISTKKCFALNNLPTEQELDEEGNVVSETTLTEGGVDGASVAYEGITLSVYYAVKCPVCHQATGGYTFYDIYSANEGCCPHCGYLFPSPSDSSMVFYRFVVVPKTSGYYDIYSEYDFTEYAEDLLGSTAKYYGEGKDLAQQALVKEDIFDETVDNGSTVSTLTGINTAFSTDNSTMSTVYNLIVGIQNWLEPITAFMSESSYIQFRTNLSLVFFTIIDKILTAPFTGLL